MKLLVGLLVTAMLVSDIVCPPVNPGVTGKVNHPDEDLSNSEVSTARHTLYTWSITVTVLYQMYII